MTKIKANTTVHVYVPGTVLVASYMLITELVYTIQP